MKTMPKAMGPPDTMPAPATFAGWLRQRVERDTGDVTRLFESSVPEPVALLREQVLETFAADERPYYRSTFAGGNPFVVASLARHYGVSEDHILCTTGATAAISIVYRSLLSQGSRVLIENPAFDLFATLAAPMVCAVDRFERPAPDYAVDPDRIVEALRPETALVVLSNLHNPSGMMMDEATLRKLARLAEWHDFHILVDEVYAPFVRDGFPSAAGLDLSDRVLSISSLSKGYGLSTLRCGWIVGNPATLDPVRRLNGELEFSISKLTHAIAARVLESPDGFSTWMFDHIAQARPVVEEFQAQWAGEGLVPEFLPRHGCVALCDPAGVEDGHAFSAWMERHHGVQIVPGEYFGAPGQFRLGFGIAHDTLREGLQRLTDGMREYRTRSEQSTG